ncbi:DUF4157 domain-containing protein [Flavobacterium jejuense]|uniref:DUF4157 domain-containing protein n=1 Tax=Flavobacterium jejuense TaxID=1544455 RepID=A0ABX0IM82_9FLAO|nr:DUF4157 domain-containing protein [Flavobacterium jejuense]NHN24917.1 DUF4157 domain-containing protein [Flavobacterium jejuense]
MEYDYKKKNELESKSVASSFANKTIQKKAVELQDNRPSSIIQKKANNTGLPDNLKSGIENLSGHAMDDVKVHYNSDKPAQLNAHAYAQGTDIHIASGQEKHLPHEAWHIVQQKQGRVKPTLQMKGKVNINDDDGLEKEADVMGAKALVQKKEIIPIKTTPFIKNPAIQRVIAFNRRNLPNGTKKFIRTKINELNTYDKKHRNTKVALHAQFKMIHDLETRINTFLTANATTISNTERSELFNVLRQTETLHLALSGRLAAHGHDMWLGNTNLSPKKQRQTQSLWHSLRTDSGNMKVEGSVAFRSQAMSGYLHMLRGNHGRGMLKEMNKPQLTADHNIIISDNHLANYTLAGKAGQHDTGSWASSIGNIRHDNQDAENGVGTGSFVQIHNTNPPATMGEYESGTHGEPIFAPNFITLAHELGHARHNLRGKTKQNAWYGVPAQNPLHGRDDEQGKWSNPEEYKNITQEENPVRLEHNMPKRKYHATIDSARATANRINMSAQLDHIYAMVPTVPPYLRTYIGPTYFAPLNTRINNTDLSIVPLAHQLQTDINTLQNNIQRTITLAKVHYYASYLKPTRKKALIGGSLLAISAAAYMYQSNQTNK